MKKPVWLLVPLAFGLAIGGRSLWIAQEKEAERDRWKKREDIIMQGKVAKLPGATLLKGNPSDLKFEKIDLGIGEIVSVSEEGDVLYRWYGNQPLREKSKDVDGFERVYLKLPNPEYRARLKNGTVRPLGNKREFRMSRSGSIYEVERPDDGPFRIWKDGKLVYESPRNESGDGIAYSWSSQSQITDDLINCNLVTTFRFQFVNGKIERHDLPQKASSNVIATSSLLGTFIKDSSNESEPSSITLLRNGAEKKIQAPFSQLGMVASKTALYLNSSLGTGRNVLKYENGRFEPIPHPPDSVYFDVQSANSRQDMLASSYSLDPESVERNLRWPYIAESYYISKGIAYSLPQLLISNGLELGENKEISYRNQVCEDGSLVIEYADHDFKHVLLLRRTK
jgi:hypothetical protein